MHSLAHLVQQCYLVSCAYVEQATRFGAKVIRCSTCVSMCEYLTFVTFVTFECTRILYIQWSSTLAVIRIVGWRDSFSTLFIADVEAFSMYMRVSKKGRTCSEALFIFSMTCNAFSDILFMCVVMERESVIRGVAACRKGCMSCRVFLSSTMMKIKVANHMTETNKHRQNRARPAALMRSWTSLRLPCIAEVCFEPFSMEACSWTDCSRHLCTSVCGCAVMCPMSKFIIVHKGLTDCTVCTVCTVCTYETVQLTSADFEDFTMPSVQHAPMDAATEHATKERRDAHEERHAQRRDGRSILTPGVVHRGHV